MAYASRKVAAQTLRRRPLLPRFAGRRDQIQASTTAKEMLFCA